MKKTKKATRAFLICLALLIICSILNWGVVTSWGNVRITRLSEIGDDGLRYSALMYVPKQASNKNPTPAILMLHGNSGNARNHESWATEFTRRGYVVISIDNLGAGDAEYNGKYGNNTPPLAFAEYLFSLPFVDSDRVVVSGHSSGAGNAVNVAKKFPVKVCTLSNPRPQEFFKAGKPFDRDLLWIVGSADKMNTEDVVIAEVAKNFINNGAISASGELEYGKLYGSYKDGNASMFAKVEGQIHEAAFTSKAHITLLLDFVQNAVETPNVIPAENQVWMWKDAIGLIGMFVFAATMLSFAVLLLRQIPFFGSICQPLPRNIGMRKGPLAISIAAAILFPLLCLYTGSFGLGELFGAREPNLSIFQVRFTNIALPLVMGLNIFGLVMFFLFHFTWGKKKYNANLRDYGIASDRKKGLDFVLIGKSALLALIVVAAGWTYLAIQGDILGTDFYCLFFGYKPVALYKLGYYIPYIIIWIICFAVASLGMNIERRLPSTGNETKDIAIAVLFNALLATFTITIMVIVENSIQIHLGTTGTALATWKTDITRLWGMPVGMFIGGAGNTYMFRKTGSIWAGAILMGTVCALGSCLYGQIQF